MKSTATDKIIPLTSNAGTCCTAPTLHLSYAEAEAVSSDLTILAHPIRLQILDMLSHSEEAICVCELEAALPVKQPTVSHHLRLLREAGLIDCEKRGQWAYYFIRAEALIALRGHLLGQLEALG